MSSDSSHAIAASGGASPIKRFSRLLAVVSGSAILAVLGLPQILAVGALSLLPLGPQALGPGLVASFVTATIGTIFCALISRTPAEICGPRVSIVVIYAALCADLVMHAGADVAIDEVLAGLSLAVVLMGVVQVIAGWTRVGEAVKFLPYPVNAGFVTGVGALVVWSQLGPLMGLEGRLTSYDWSALLESAKPWEFLVGVAVMASVWLIPRFSKHMQPILVGLVFGTALYHGLAGFMGRDALGPTVGAITFWSGAERNIAMAWSRLDINWLLDTSVQVLPYSGFLAIQGVMNGALTSVALADATGVRPNVNRIILAQGVTNVLCGLLAALPVSPSPSQSLPAAKMREVNTVVPAASGVALLVALLVLEPVLAQVPIVVLAALLITAGIGLIDSWTKRLLARAVRGRNTDPKIMWNLAIVLTVAGSLFFGNVPLALMVGAVMATILLLIELSSSTELTMQEGVSMASSRVWPVDQQGRLQRGRSAIRIFRPRGGLFFATADQLAGNLEMLDQHVRYCVIDCSRLSVLDATGCRIIASSAKKLAGRGITTVLAGLDAANERDKGLIELGLDAPSSTDRWFRDLDHALEWIEIELLKEYSPDVATGAPVALEAAQLTAGLNSVELDVLKPHLLTTRLETGDTLFKGGTPGSSIYIIGSGLIDIRIDTDQSASGWRRMAVLGPGCIFGEVAMLTGGQRSADAVCVAPAQLFELTQESLHALSTQFPAIHSRILANLNRHLATRLIAATEIARSI
jgi:SulP family sulfate permease